MKRIAKIFLLNLFLTTSLIAQDDEFGIASYYSDLFQGKPTASGELYDKVKMTAAHKTLPFGTIVTVTRLDNNKTVQVRINDRGPFISGRVIELSRAAATQLDLITDGSARVRVSQKEAAPKPAVATTEKDKAPTSYEDRQPAIAKKEVPKPATTKPAAPTKPAAAAANTPKLNTKPGTEKVVEKGVEPAPVATSVLVKKQDYKTYDLYEVELKRPEKKGFGVQVAALTSQDALFRKIAELQGEWFENILISVEKGEKGEVSYKIMLGSFATEAEAQVYKRNLKKNKKIDGFVVNLEDLNQDK